MLSSHSKNVTTTAYRETGNYYAPVFVWNKIQQRLAELSHVPVRWLASLMAVDICSMHGLTLVRVHAVEDNG